QRLEDDALGALVGDGDGRGIFLAANSEIRGVNLHDRRAGSDRRVRRVLQQRLQAGCHSAARAGATSRIACQTRSGVAGISTCSRRYSESPRTRALMTAGGAPSEPASPAPLMPSGLVVQGTTL